MRLLEEPIGLRPHEDALLELIFTTKKGDKKRKTKLSEMSKLISSSRWKVYGEAVKAELKSAGWWDEARIKQRKILVFLGVLLFAVAAAFFVIALSLMEQWGNNLLMVPFSIFVLGVGTMILGASVSSLSDNGRQEKAPWKSFADHLKQVSKGKASKSSPTMFTDYLPYAAGFGYLHKWAKHFEKEGGAEIPSYFHVSPHSSNHMAAFVAMSAVTASSGGSAAGAAGAGAGAAGGGASGAG